jgi:hypothetical protein
MSGPFHFLDLPPELRLMVYENISIDTRYYVFGGPKIWPDHPPWSVTLIRRTLPLDILVTSRLVHAEALEIFDARIRELERTPIRLIMGYYDLRRMMELTAVLGRWPTPFLVPCQKLLAHMRTLSGAQYRIEIVLLSTDTEAIMARWLLDALYDLCWVVFKTCGSVVILHSGILPSFDTRATLDVWRERRKYYADLCRLRRLDEEVMDVKELDPAEWAVVNDEISMYPPEVTEFADALRSTRELECEWRKMTLGARHRD